MVEKTPWKSSWGGRTVCRLRAAVLLIAGTVPVNEAEVALFLVLRSGGTFFGASAAANGGGGPSREALIFSFENMEEGRKVAAVSSEEWQAFFARNFSQRDQRRNLLLKWHSLKWSGTEERVAREFERFIRTLLYEAPEFHLRSDSFLLFGDRYPIRLEWLSPQDRQFCLHLFRLRDKAFAQCKEYANGQIDYTTPLVAEANVFAQLWREQITRDFVHVVYGLRHDALVLELIAALQWLLLDAPRQSEHRFLRALLAGLQGRCDIAEVMCIE
jgi:hypothetical protein